MAKPKAKAARSSAISQIGRLYRIRSSAVKKPVIKKKAQTEPEPQHKPRKFKPVPTARTLMAETLQFVWENRRTFFLITATYALIYIVLVTGFSNSTSSTATTKNLESLLGRHPFTNSLITSVVVLFGSNGANTESNASGQFFQVLLPVLASIVIIWTIRRLKSGQPMRIRDAFYRSMQPLIPFILVLLVLVIRLLPLLIGSYIFVVARTNGFATSMLQTWFFGACWLLLTVGSFVWMVPAVLAIYAVTLPDVDPLQALKATRLMVRTQRWKVLMRLLTGVVIGAIIAMCLVFLCVYWAPWLVVPLSLVISFIGLLLLNVYGYHVYRSLL